MRRRLGRLVIQALTVTVALSGCNDLGRTYTEKLRPLNIVTYVATDGPARDNRPAGRKVVRKEAYFTDRSSNVVTLIDDARDGLLPGGDQDGFVDRMSFEVYDRGLLFDVLISRGIVYQDNLTPQKIKPLRELDREVLAILTEKFVKQSQYLKSASKKTEYGITLRDIRKTDGEVIIDVDGSEERLKRGELRQINGVYMMLDKIKAFESDFGFALIRISNQGIHLKPCQKTRILVVPGEFGRGSNKFLREERIHFEFEVSDTIPDRRAAMLEDIFHTFLVDWPNNEHVSFYRMVREMSDTEASKIPSRISGVRTIGDQFKDIPEGGILADLSGHVKDAVKDMMRFLYGKRGVAFW